MTNLGGTQRGSTAAPAPDAGPQLHVSSAAGRWVLLATVLGSSMVLLDSTVVNVALPTIGRDLNASLAGLQWTVTGYTLSLAGLILLGGSLGDRAGRRRVFLIGVVWFALASVLCGAASYIAVPAVQRLAIPEASPTLPLAASLGLTFSYNVTIGIPLYIEINRLVSHWF